MGIIGLARYIESSNSDPRIYEVIEAHSVLLIDGVAFMVQILDRCSFRHTHHSQYALSCQLIQSFSYERFHDKLCEEMNNFMGKFGFKPIVYFDNAAVDMNNENLHVAMKARTSASRREQKERAWNSLYRQFTSGGASKGAAGQGPRLWSTSQTPWPSLLHAQMKASLDHLDIPYYSRDSPLPVTMEATQQKLNLIPEADRGGSTHAIFLELIQLTVELESGGDVDTTHVDADCIMAHHCDFLNRKYGSETDPACAFVYSRDSDFIVMRGCPYIELGSLRPADGGRVRARVFRRPAVAAALNLSEHQLVEFCLLLGNDFCAHHQRASMVHKHLDIEDDTGNSSGAAGRVSQHEVPPKLFSNVHSVRSIDMIRKWVRGAGGTQQASNSNKKRQKGSGGQHTPVVTECRIVEFQCYSRIAAVDSSLRYCRTFYEHDLVGLCRVELDLSPGDRAPSCTPARSAPYYLTTEESAQIASLVPLLERDCDTATSIGEVAVDCMLLMGSMEESFVMSPSGESECCDEDERVAAQKKDYVGVLDPDLSLFRWNCVSERHLDALRAMLVRLRSCSQTTAVTSQAPFRAMAWDDVVVGLLFEQVIRALAGIQRGQHTSYSAPLSSVFMSCDSQPRRNMDWLVYSELLVI